MCSTIQTFANTGVTHISVANSNLNGTGTIGVVLTSPGSLPSPGAGTLIKSITIKATQSTSEGMVRLFIGDHHTYSLYKEIYIPQTTQTSVESAFRITIDEDLVLNPGQELCVSTEKSEGFNVMANAYNWIGCSCTNVPTCGDGMRYVANTGCVTIQEGNSELDGGGPMETIIVANSSSSLDGGTQIPSVTVKATQSVTQGMVRLFLDDTSGNVFLFREIPIPAVTQTAVEPAYRTVVELGLYLQSGYTLLASTENSESFNVIVTATDWINCSCPEG